MEFIEKTVEQIAASFGAEDAESNKAFKDGIRAACVANLLSLINKPAVVVAAAAAAPAAAVAAPAAANHLNGYHIYSQELRAKLVTELGSEEAAKEEFKKRGGQTGPWIRDGWHALTKEQKDVFNAKAKAGRMPAATPGAVPIAAAKRATSKWQQFQKAWNAELKAKAAAKEVVPVYAALGDRTKACSAAYKEFQKGTAEVQSAYLTKFTA